MCGNIAPSRSFRIAPFHYVPHTADVALSVIVVLLDQLATPDPAHRAAPTNAGHDFPMLAAVVVVGFCNRVGEVLFMRRYVAHSATLKWGN
jgi:hypothetical protein